MIEADIHRLIPTHKSDLKTVDAAVAAGYPAVEPILPELLMWIQDINWPVAQGLAGFLASIGEPLIPHIEEILETDDQVWKVWIISYVIRESPALAHHFRGRLAELAGRETTDEDDEWLREIARDVLEEHGWCRVPEEGTIK